MFGQTVASAMEAAEAGQARPGPPAHEEGEESASSPFNGLPSELSTMIFTWLRDESVPVCAFVCKLWRDILAPRLASMRSEELTRTFSYDLAAAGHLRVLRWAIEEQGCPLDNSTC